MEFDINVNSLFRDVITMIDSRLQICRNAGSSYPEARLQLFDIINKMGEASARAQGLAGAITTGRRLETSDHHLYVMKDTEGSRGQGSMIGILKIGRKRLFVYDRHGQQWEMNPLCILDFYVHESRQRMGCGRRLFDFMLKAENMAPQHLAVDRPSLKFSSFLAKHYGLRTEIPQVNNFVIFEGFFTKRPDGDFIHNRRNANLAKPADYPSKGGQDAPAGWQGSNNYNNSGSKLNGGYPRSHTGLPNHGSRPPSGPHTKVVAAGLPSIMPRHQAANYPQGNSLKDLNLNPRSAQAMPSPGNNSPRGLSDMELRSVSAGSSNANRATNLQLQSAMYSRHQPVDTTPTLPNYTTAQRPPSGARNNGATAALRHRPPSGSKAVAATREKSPPLLQRDGPPQDYMDSFNLHHNYQGRAGHLVVPPPSNMGGTETFASVVPPSIDPKTRTGAADVTVSKPVLDIGRAAYSHRDAYYTNPTMHTQADTSWTVFGVLRKQNHLSARQSGRTRLW